MTLFASSRARRIFGGWSANIVQLLLALTQQIVLIPLFLKFWTSDTLSAWLTIFAAGNLVLAADAGLHAWALNRFLSFKSRNDCDRRTSRYYGAVFQLFVWFTALFAILLLAAFGLIAPSKVLGFSAEPGFDLAFADHDAGRRVHAARRIWRARFTAPADFMDGSWACRRGGRRSGNSARSSASLRPAACWWSSLPMRPDNWRR